MHVTVKAGMVVFCALGITTACSVAQEMRLENAAAAADKKVDGMAALVENPFRLSATLSGVYTDNRDSMPDGENNFDVILTPSISLGVIDEQGSLDFQYAPSLRYRSNSSDIQNDFALLHDLSFNGEFKATPEVRLRLREKFNYTDDPSVTTSGVTIRENRSYILNNLEGGLNWRFIRWSDVDVYASHMLKKYEKDIDSVESDRDSLEAGLAMWRQVANTVGVQGILRLNSYGFDEVNGVQRDFDLINIVARAEKSINPNLRGAVQLGWQQATYKDDGLDSKSSPFFAVDMRGKLLPVLDVTASFTHGVRDADVYPFSSQDYDQVVARVTYEASPVVTFGVMGVYRLSQYDTDMVPTTATSTDFAQGVRKGDETTVSFGADMNVKLGQTSSITLAQNYEDVNSDVYYSFTKNTTSLALTASF